MAQNAPSDVTMAVGDNRASRQMTTESGGRPKGCAYLVYMTIFIDRYRSITLVSRKPK